MIGHYYFTNLTGNLDKETQNIQEWDAMPIHTHNEKVRHIGEDPEASKKCDRRLSSQKI